LQYSHYTDGSKFTFQTVSDLVNILLHLFYGGTCHRPKTGPTVTHKLSESKMYQH